MKGIKQWLKSLDDKQITRHLSDFHSFKSVPDSRDKDITERIDKGSFFTKEEIDEFNKKKALTLGIRLLAAASVFAVVLIVLFNFNFFFKEEIVYEITPVYYTGPIYYSGNVEFFHEEQAGDLTIGKDIAAGDTIQTGASSECRLQLGNSMVVMKEKSRVQFISTGKDKTLNALYLEEGKIFINIIDLPEDTTFSVTTVNAVIEAIGTQFSVETTENNSSIIISLYEGSLKVTYYTEDDEGITVILKEQEVMIIKNNIAETNTINPEISREFKELENIEVVSINENAQVIIKAEGENVLLDIDGKEKMEFQDRIGLFLTTGKHTLSIEKPGFEKQVIYLDLDQNEVFIKEIFFKEEEKSQIEEPEEKESTDSFIRKGDFFYKKIYPDDNSPGEMIMGFVKQDNYAVAQTETRLICFNLDGVVEWESDYKDSSVSFVSLPVIFNNYLFVFPSINKIIVIDLFTGEELKRIETSGNPGSLRKPYCLYNNSLFLALSDGIYSLDMGNNLFQLKKMINIENPAQPVIMDKIVYCSSLKTNQLYAFDPGGNMLWSLNLFSGGTGPVFYSNDHIFTGDKLGYIYKISKDGLLNKKILLSSKINSELVFYNRYIFILTDEGTLYKINESTLAIENTYKIDSKGDDSLYPYKSLFIRDNKGVIGTNEGNIIILNLYTDMIEETLKLSESAISCSVLSLGDCILAGTDTGEVYLIKF